MYTNSLASATPAEVPTMSLQCLHEHPHGDNKNVLSPNSLDRHPCTCRHDAGANNGC